MAAEPNASQPVAISLKSRCKLCMVVGVVGIEPCRVADGAYRLVARGAVGFG